MGRIAACLGAKNLRRSNPVDSSWPGGVFPLLCPSEGEFLAFTSGFFPLKKPVRMPANHGTLKPMVHLVASPAVFSTLGPEVDVMSEQV